MSSRPACPHDVLVLLGAAFLFGDGIITPAISVLARSKACESHPRRSSRPSCRRPSSFLRRCSAVQRRGSGSLGRYFGPVMALWLGTALVLGVIHVLQRPEVVTALSPHHGIEFLVREQFAAFRALGGVVLSVTGGEALYADMGHFGRRPILIAWLTFALPALILNYLGQGAVLLDHAEAARQPFYAMVPAGPAGLPFVLLGTAATVIASQALISGVFSLVYQGIRLGYFPRITIRHTSRETMGQIYVPVHEFRFASAPELAIAGWQQAVRPIRTGWRPHSGWR